jgi:tetratricopeptide (TPR) repeat protein
MSAEELEAAYQQNPRDVDVALALGIRYHDALREAGRNEAYRQRPNRKKLDALYQKALKYLKRAQFMTRFGPVPNAYIGSLTVLRGRDVCYSDRGLLVRWRGPKNFSEGPPMIDEAVRQAPDDATVRLVRIADAVHVPYRLTDGSDPTKPQEWVVRRDRIELGLGDVDFLLRKRADGAPVDRLPELHLAGGRLAISIHEFDRARDHLEKAIVAGGDSPAAEQAEALLEKLPRTATDPTENSSRMGPQ